MASEIEPRGKRNRVGIDAVTVDYKKTTAKAVQKNSNERKAYGFDHQRASAAFEATQGNQNPFLNRSVEEEGHKRNSFGQCEHRQCL